MFNSIMKTFSLGSQNCNVTDMDFLLLIVGLVKFYSLQVISLPAPPWCMMMGGGEGTIMYMGIK